MANNPCSIQGLFWTQRKVELWCLLLALFVSLMPICHVSGVLPLDLWTINADVMMVKSASGKVSDMKDCSYLNLKETESDESSKWLTNICPTGAMYTFFLTIPLTKWTRMFFWQIISLDVKLNMLFTLILLQDPKMFFDSSVVLIQN